MSQAAHLTINYYLQLQIFAISISTLTRYVYSTNYYPIIIKNLQWYVN